jgi:hypothetical protein
VTKKVASAVFSITIGINVAEGEICSSTASTVGSVVVSVSPVISNDVGTICAISSGVIVCVGSIFTVSGACAKTGFKVGKVGMLVGITMDVVTGFEEAARDAGDKETPPANMGV